MAESKTTTSEMSDKLVGESSDRKERLDAYTLVARLGEFISLSRYVSAQLATTADKAEKWLEKGDISAWHSINVFGVVQGNGNMIDVLAALISEGRDQLLSYQQEDEGNG